MLEGASLGPDMTDEDRASTSMTVASFNTISQVIWSICQEKSIVSGTEDLI